MRKHNYNGTAAAVLTAVILLTASGVGAAATGIGDNGVKPYAACAAKDTYVEEAVINNRISTITKGEKCCLWLSDRVGEVDLKNWSSSDSDIAQVDWTGCVTGISEGRAVISLTEDDGTVIDSIEITVIDSAVTTVTTAVTERMQTERPQTESIDSYDNAVIVLDHTQMVEGQSVELELTGAEDAGKISWKSEAPALAGVDENGRVTAYKQGDATICCYDENGSRIADITLFIYKEEDVVREAVIYDKISSLEMNTDGWLHWEGEGVYDTVVWSSSDYDVLTVSWRGIVYACGEGEAVIYLKNISGETLDSVTIKVE